MKKTLQFLAFCAIVVPLYLGLSTLVSTKLKASNACPTNAICTEGIYQFTSTDSTTPVTLYTATASGVAVTGGAKILGVYVATATSGAVPYVQLYKKHGGTSYLLTTVYIGSIIGQGPGGAASPNLLLNSLGTPSTLFLSLPVDDNGNPFILMAAGDSLQGAMQTALTSPQKITMFAQVVQY